MQIAVTSPSFCRNPLLVEELRTHFPMTRLNTQGRELSGQDLVDFLQESECAIIGREPVTAQVLAALPDLRFIAKYGVGLDNIDLDYALKKNITVAFSPGTNRRSVAELALCFLLGLAHNIFFSYNALRQGQWIKNGGQQLSEKTVGIIGCGHAGSELAMLLAPLQCKLLVNDIVDKTEFFRQQKDSGQDICLASKEEIYAACDFITLHVPLTKETQKMINASVLHEMKTTAYLINTSRGAVIDESALKESLRLKRIAGAALDVFSKEPLQDRELLALPNVVVTPHIGGSAQEAMLAMGMAAIEHLCEYKSRVEGNIFSP